jgi:hypothetical protein
MQNIPVQTPPLSGIRAPQPTPNRSRTGAAKADDCSSKTDPGSPARHYPRQMSEFST